ncbi:MAG: DUF3054 family protein [Anaerolineae bacterium]|nr:DUF3054 family protein [Candidatus Roseilinea sp.]MDW8449349.1 DUF3054 family protein [Anaerolineae bacterium]
MNKLTYRRILLIGDVLAVAAFVIVGQYFHNMTAMANAALRAVEQIAAIGLPFILLAWLLGAYPARHPETWREMGLFLLRSALAFIYAVPTGLFIRAWLFGQPTVLLAFASMALLFSAMFVLGWRVLFAAVSVVLRKRRQQRWKEQLA